MKSMSKGLGVLRERRTDPLGFPYSEAWNPVRMYHSIPLVMTKCPGEPVLGLNLRCGGRWQAERPQVREGPRASR